MAGVKGKSGRKKKVVELAQCGQILAAAAIPAARYLADIVRGKVKRPSWSKIEVCKFIIDHHIGRASVKHEITGAGGTPLTWQMVVMMAEEADQNEQTPKIIGGVRLIPTEAP